MEQKEKKNLGYVLSSIGKSGRIASHIFSIGVLTYAIVLNIAAFPGESIKVPKGLTLSQISVQHGISQEELVKRNREIKNPDDIQEGQDLTLYDEGARGVLQKTYDTLDNWF